MVEYQTSNASKSTRCAVKAGQRQVLSEREMPLDRTIEQILFNAQRRMTLFGQRLGEIFDHRAQAAHDLQAVCAAKSDLTEPDVHEIFPVGRAENQPYALIVIHKLVGAQVAQADQAQQAVQLVDGEHGRCRIVDRRRQRLQRDIDQNAKSEQRILLDRALYTEGNQLPQPAIVDRARIAIKVEKRLINGDEVSHLGGELDDAIGALRFGYQRWHVRGQNDAGVAKMINDTLRRAAPG